ncbi:hypothetical protein [Salinarimonas chemoclinalis]|uniref:hypothetical protein n=1 Tax=Salinarimonas chemoclinalis TaxID=3241599 RepID=UPI00355617F2
MFVRSGFVIAWLAMVFGAIRITIGLFVASIGDAAERAAAAAYRLGSRSSGEAIDQGIMVFVFGVALGLLAEIAKAVKQKQP